MSSTSFQSALSLRDKIDRLPTDTTAQPTDIEKSLLERYFPSTSSYASMQWMVMGKEAVIVGLFTMAVSLPVIEEMIVRNIPSIEHSLYMRVAVKAIVASLLYIAYLYASHP